MPFPYLFPFYFSNPSQSFIIWVDNVDVTNKTRLGASLSYSSSAVGTLNITFESTVTVSSDSVVKIYDITRNIFIFSGTVREYTHQHETYNTYVKNCVVHDYTRAIYDATGITGSYSDTEKGIITTLFAAECPSIIIGSNVITGNSTTLILADNSLSEALSTLGETGGRLWWVDPYLELHYGNTVNWPHAAFDLSDTPDFSATYPYHQFDYTRDNISATASTNQISLKTFYSGLQIGTYAQIYNATLGFTGETYYITDISARLMTTFDSTVQWEYTVSLRDSTTLASTVTGHGNNSLFTNRLWNIPDPTKPYHIANKRYVDSKVNGVTSADVSATKVLDTIYRNTSGKTRFVQIAFEVSVYFGAGIAANAAGIEAWVENNSNPTAQTNSSIIGLSNPTPGGIAYTLDYESGITFIVPPGWYYKVVTYEVAPATLDSVISWYEYDIG